MKAYLNIDELADCLNLSKGKLYEMTSKRKIPFLRVGRRVLFDPERIERWMATQEVKGAPA